MAKKSDDLRRKALEILELRKNIPNKDLIAQDVDKLVEELSIYQVELELQNEELLQRQSDLNQAKEQYENLFDTSPNGYLLIDENFNIVKCNATITKMWGYGKSILLKSRLNKFIHPDDQDKAYLKCKTVFSSNEITNCEVRIKNIKDNWIHCRFDAYYEGKENEKDMVRVSVVDIEKDVKARAEIEKISQDRKDLLDSISDGFFVLDKNLTVKYFNDSAEQMLGRKREDVLGVELFEAFPEAKNSVFEKNYMKGIREKEYQEFEVFFEVDPYKNWYKVRVFPNNGGIAVFFQVVTKQKELEISLQDKNEEIARQNEELQSQNEELKTQNEEIRLSNEQLQELNAKVSIEKQTAQNYLDIAGNMFIAINKDGIVTLANQKASEVLGFPVEQIIGKNWFDNFLPDDYKKEVKNVFSKIINGEVESVEYVENQVVCRDGSIKWIAWHNTDIRDEKARIMGTLSSGVDITEKYLADMELRKIEWMLSPKTKKEEQDFPIYGDLTKLNTERTILDSVGKDVLDDIVQDYLSLLDTSAAVYEKNGDYALGIFSSKWCRFLDEKSRGLCSQSDNKEALESGQWLCHESCWTDASKKAIETKKAADIKCAGGLNIYALPIWANNEVIGAINFGYGTPPKTSKDLSVISKKFKVPVEDLIEIAERYEERPNFIIDIAKERLAISARLIGEIVERKNAKNALALSEEKFRSYIENAPDGIFITNEKGEYLEVNPAACQITGYAENELIGKKIPNLLQKEYLEKGAEHFQKVIKNGFAKGEIGFITKSGEERFWEIDAVKLSETRFMGFTKDITERIKTQKALHESESKLKSVVENSTNMFYQHDTNHVLTFLSPQVKDILGYEVEEALKNWNTMASDHPINEVGFQHTMKAIETGKPQPTYELELLHKSGRKIRVEVREAPIIENGKTIAIAGSLNDITERKKAEEEIKISEKKFRRLVETASDAIYLMSAKGELVDTNEAATRMLGYSKSELLEKTIDQIDPNYPLDDFLKFWEAIPYEESNVFETTHQDKEGNLIPVEISGVKYKIDGEDYYYGIARDITERKEAERKILASEEKYRLYFDHAPVGYQSLDENGCIIDVNQSWIDTLGYERKEVIGKWFGDFLHPDQKEIFKKLFPENIKSTETISGVEYILKTKNGEFITAEYTARIGRDEDGKFIRTHCVFADITEKKKAEKALNDHLTFLDAIIEESPYAMWIAGLDGKLIRVNKSLCDNLNLSKEVVLQEYNVFEDQNLVSQNLMNKVRSVFNKGENVRFTVKWVPENSGADNFAGSELWIDVSMFPIFDSVGNISNVACQWIDITQLKENEIRIRESEEKYKALFENIQEGVALHKMIYDEKGEPVDFIFLDVNSTYEELTQLKKEEIIGKRGKEVIPNIEDKWIELYGKVAKTEEPVSVTDHSEYLDKYWDVKAYSPEKDHFAVALSEVTEKIKAQKELEESEARFRSIIEESADAIFIVDQNGDYVFANQKSSEMLGYSVEELLEMNIKQVGTQDKDGVRFNTILKEGKLFTNLDLMKKSGEVFKADLNAVLMPNGSIYGSCRDLSDFYKLQLELIESEERFRELVNTINSGVAIYEVINDGKTGSDYIIKEFNKFSLEHEGMKKEEVLGKSLKDIRPNIDEYGLIDTFRKVWKTGEPEYFPAKIYVDEKYSNYYENRVFKLPSDEIVAIYDDVTEKKQSEILLAEAQERYEKAMNATSDGIFDWNLKTNEIYYSPGWKKMLGYEDHELKNEFSVWETLTHKDDMKESWRLLNDHLEGKTLRYEMEFRMKHKAGHWVDILSRAEAAFDENGNAERVVGTHVDISEKNEFLQKIAESEEKHRVLLENTGAGIGYYTVDGELILFNQLAADYMGGKPEDFTGKSIVELYGDDLGKQYINRIKNAAESASSVEYEDEVKLPTGNLWFLSTYTKIKNSKDEVMGVQIISKDITVLKQIELDLKRSEAKFKGVFDHSNIGIALTDVKGNLLDANKEFLKVLGYSQKELLEMSVKSLTFNDDYEKEIPLIKSMLANEISEYRMEKRYYHKNGSTVWVDLSVASRKDSNGKVDMLIGMVIDITDKKKVLEELEEHKTNLEIMVNERTDELASANEELASTNEELQVTNEDLAEKNQELERFNELFVGREFRINELKEKIKELEEKLKNTK
jgi:PAS domain S-box-containing protein